LREAIKVLAFDAQVTMKMRHGAFVAEVNAADLQSNEAQPRAVAAEVACPPRAALAG
jgi:DNA-binding FadR family transcriptional regulator